MTEETNSAEETQEPKKTKNENKLMDEMTSFDLGGVYAGVNNLLKKSKNLDVKLTSGAGNLYAKFTGHFKNSIDSHNKKK